MNATSPSTDDFPSAAIDPLICDAERFVAFYRDRWRAAGCQAKRQFYDRAGFQQLPITRKADLLDKLESERLDVRYTPDRLCRESTSGSTGEPFTMYFNRAAWLRRRLRFLRALIACGYRFGQSTMLISSRHSSLLMRTLRWQYLDLQLGERAMCAKYQTIKPHTLYGPLSALLLMSEQVSNSRAFIHRPKLVISTAEQLTPGHQRLLEKAFAAKVADFYGSTELGLVAWRRPGFDYYEIATSDLYLEFIPVGGQSRLERLIVTDLRPGPMPLIRFDTGDLVRRNHDLPGSPICEFVGREVDSLKLPNGDKISPYQITMAMEEIVGIDRYEVVQRRNLHIDIYVWTHSTNTPSALKQAEAIVAKLCNWGVSVTAHYSTQKFALSERKSRPVRSEAAITS